MTRATSSCRCLAKARRALRHATALALLGGVLSAAAGSDGAPPPEYGLKAAFLVKFTQFIEWPGAAFSAADGPLVLGVLGDDPFGPVLDEAVKDETVNGHPLVVRRFRRLENLTACHMLFICQSEKARLAPILRRVRGKGVLTIGETDQFATQGGIINLVTVQKRVGFEINLEAAEDEGLRLSAKLLRLARIVRSAPRPEDR